MGLPCHVLVDERRQGSAKKLIQAAVWVADGKQATPPPELETAWQCKRWNCLPDAGGYLDQEYSLVMRMSMLDNVHSFMVYLRSLVGDRIHTLDGPARRLWRWLIEEGYYNG